MKKHVQGRVVRYSEADLKKLQSHTRFVFGCIHLLFVDDRYDVHVTSCRVHTTRSTKVNDVITVTSEGRYAFHVVKISLTLGPRDEQSIRDVQIQFSFMCLRAKKFVPIVLLENAGPHREKTLGGCLYERIRRAFVRVIGSSQASAKVVVLPAKVRS
jgi:hypothetical protein